jgi:hypothetical protein
VVCRSDEPVAVEMDHSTVMMSLAQGMYFGLEGAGPRIWGLLAQPRSVMELCAALTEEFEVEPEACLRDVCGFLGELQRADLIRIDDEPADPIPPAERR